MDRQAATLLMPVSARRALHDLPDDAWTKINVEFYRDPADGVFKALLRPALTPAASAGRGDKPGIGYNAPPMWTKMMNRPRKKPPKKIAVIDPERCFGAFACSICQAACPVEDCIVEEPDVYGRMVCAVRVDKCIGCGLCVTVGNPTAPQPRDFGCPPDYDAIDMEPYEAVVPPEPRPEAKASGDGGESAAAS